MQTPVIDKRKILVVDPVERQIDINTTDDGTQGEVTLVVEQEDLIVGEPHLVPTEIDQAESSSRWQLRSAAKRQAPTRYDICFNYTIIDDMKADVEDSHDVLIIEDGDPSSFS